MSKARIVLPIEGMSCASCAATVQAALGDAAGVSTATVNYATGKGAVDYDDAQTNVAELIKTVRAAGYDCGRAGVTFTVEQLHYAPSVAPLEQSLRGVPGVIRAAANQATETVTVDYIPGATTADALERAVERAGFRVAAPIAAEDPLERERLAREREVRALTWRFALAALVTAVSVLGSMLLMAHDADATLKQIDLLGRLLMPLAVRLQDALAGRGALEISGASGFPPGDGDAAFAYLLAQKDVDPTRLAVGGSSCGATDAADLAARRRDIRAVLLLSGLPSPGGTAYLTTTPAPPVFGIYAEQDFGAGAMRSTIALSKHPRSTLKMFPGSGHGVELFTQHPDLQQATVKWLQDRVSKP